MWRGSDHPHCIEQLEPLKGPKGPIGFTCVCHFRICDFHGAVVSTSFLGSQLRGIIDSLESFDARNQLLAFNIEKILKEMEVSRRFAGQLMSTLVQCQADELIRSDTLKSLCLHGRERRLSLPGKPSHVNTGTRVNFRLGFSRSVTRLANAVCT